MESGLVQFIVVLTESLSADFEDILWFSTRKDIVSVAIVSPLVGLLFLVVRIRSVSQELLPACSYSVAG
jgi:hypothetical protein